MMNNDTLFSGGVLPLYHETVRARYFDNGDGSLTVRYKGKYVCGQCLAHVKNDEDGWRYINGVLKPLYGNRRNFAYMYRCPETGQTYDEINGSKPWSCCRRGHIRKDQALVIAVY